MALGLSFILHHVMTAVNLALYNGARDWINGTDFYLHLCLRQGIHKRVQFDLSFKIKDLTKLYLSNCFILVRASVDMKPIQEH